jgi:hypothetical protein
MISDQAKEFNNLFNLIKDVTKNEDLDSIMIGEQTSVRVYLDKILQREYLSITAVVNCLRKFISEDDSSEFRRLLKELSKYVSNEGGQSYADWETSVQASYDDGSANEGWR